MTEEPNIIVWIVLFYIELVIWSHSAIYHMEKWLVEQSLYTC